MTRSILNGTDHKLEYDDGQMFTTLHDRAESLLALASPEADTAIMQTICDKVNRHDALVIALRSALAAHESAGFALEDYEVAHMRALCDYVSPADWAPLGEIMRKRGIPGDNFPGETDTQMARRIACEYRARMTTREREQFEAFGGWPDFSDVRRAFPDGEEYHTGGGCTAFRIPLPGDCYALVTDPDDPRMPEDCEAGEVTLGVYDDDGGIPSDGECCEILEVAEVPARIVQLRRELGEAVDFWHD